MSKRGRGSAGTQPITEKRSTFNVEKDIFLLQICLQHNPWQTEDRNWKLILDDMKNKYKEFPDSLSVRSLKSRVNRLINQYKSEQLKVKTGTEEQMTERANLIQEVIAIMESLDIPINTQLGAEETLNEFDDDLPILTEDEVLVTMDGLSGQKKAKSKNEKFSADQERNVLLSALESDLAQSPKDVPKKRPKLTFEEGLTEAKLSHDFAMEKMRQSYDLEKLNKDFLLDTQKLEVEKSKNELEKARLALELKKETRLEEESKRREENTAAQLKLQSDMYQLMLKLADQK